ncbi:dihydroxyacetone kinase [Alkalihalobacillus alcalophilus ATCC 27647 = CGMCC 1.3604]|uniref:phosphoenolpyruvate--glycerone phosphotransferase n=1 Tax=Alkalihalobacillus alcalophilus ATCC 27647 = CGMCC 1.3604 TaxID=1218173 RepID=A0A094WNG6_ALKAL|nr:dihydroxyacetone kinase subunit DhaL [Alkalihalobacillus alcalophilus]KGA98381.1 dihydroxyacetone kinase [Alkalihalobacillus alcalophilus ATCC 27647 = CGMCC 1.3604]MED1563914.1 dihydroxyacetone kinase subunit DhaL [Alkalihalobacillus alcalophilus]THG91596.1 dihydroxyacetone kinase [Alkalihalobacillus alcalophilus ATCC 27647 = CGMCC 1.3604]
MNFSAQDLLAYLKNVVHVMEENKDYLCELDRKLGDGDHGVTMSIGWQAVNEKLEHELKEESDCSRICITTGRTFLSAVGSSVGPLYATGFLKGAKAIQNKSELTEEDLKNFWIEFIKGIKERGQAEVGDKTMVDTLHPALESLSAYENNMSFVEYFTKTVLSAKQGMESTKDLLSKRGRSSRLGERSIGNQDPGATSAYLMLETFLQTLKTSQVA